MVQMAFSLAIASFLALCHDRIYSLTFEAPCATCLKAAAHLTCSYPLGAFELQDEIKKWDQCFVRLCQGTMNNDL